MKMRNLYVAVFLEAEYQRAVRSDIWPYPVMRRGDWITFLLGINP
jgi:hypothetical protein